MCAEAVEHHQDLDGRHVRVRGAELAAGDALVEQFGESPAPGALLLGDPVAQQRAVAAEVAGVDPQAADRVVGVAGGVREEPRRAEIADAAAAIAADVRAGKLDPSKVNEKTVAKYMYYPDMPDVDLFVRPSGEQRTSNYLIWQSAYAEMVFQDILWPDFDRRNLWDACFEYAKRDRRFGAAPLEDGEQAT
ncbi:UDP pyrophosphate synthase [Streptomyces noursei ZPM]|nr:UDP pyrophosphate synthase [Streptomyces noursei ZPM]